MQDLLARVGQAAEDLGPVASRISDIETISVSAWCLRSDSAVATTSSRQLGRCWKSPLGGIHFHSMMPTSSGSYTTASGSRRCSSAASVVLPAPNPPLSQMITGTSYPGKPRAAGTLGRITFLLSG